MDTDNLENNNKSRKRQIHKKRSNTSDAHKQKVKDPKQYKRSKHDTNPRESKNHLRDNDQNRVSHSPTCNGFQANEPEKRRKKENIPKKVKILSNLDKVDSALKLLDEQLKHFSVSTDIPYNNNLFDCLILERDVIGICKNIQEILSENVSNSSVQSNNLPGNTDVQGSGKDMNETEKDALTNQRPVAADKPNNVTMEDNSDKEQCQNPIDFENMELDDIISDYIPNHADQNVDSSENTEVNKTSKDSPKRTDDYDDVSSQDLDDDIVMAPPANFKNVKSPKNCFECPTPSYYKQDDELSLCVQTPLREEFDTDYDTQNQNNETPILNHNNKPEKVQENVKISIKRLEIYPRVKFVGAVKKSLIFKLMCAQYARGQCRRRKCFFGHKWPKVEDVKSVLAIATRSQLIEEYNIAQKIYYSKKRYTMCFVNECIKRQETRILLEITFDIIRRRWFQGDPIVDDVLYASLSQLNNAKLDEFDDILLLKDYKIFHDELILAIIRSDYAELSTYEIILQKLVDFVLKNKYFLNIKIAKKLLYKLIDMETLSTRMAQIATTVFCKTNPSIFKMPEISIFKTNLKRKNSELFDNFCNEEYKILQL